MIDTSSIRDSNDLLSVIGTDTRLKRVAGTGGGEWAGPCPFGCGCRRDGFHVQPNAPGGGRWFCRKCTNGEWRDVIEYVMLRDRLDFLGACEALGARRARAGARPVESSVPSRPAPAPLPSLDWQAQARQAMAKCQAALWSGAGLRARTWLHNRGLRDETLQRWKLGYVAPASQGWRRVCGLWVPCGILVPGEVDGVLSYLKVRRPNGPPKYMHVRGGRPAPYLTATLAGREAAVLVEGEFDALLLWQEAGDLAGIATLGSAADRIDAAAWGKRLAGIKYLFLAYHADDAGQAGARKVAEALPRARPVKVPVLNHGHKDLTDYHCAGGRLRDWLTYVLMRSGPGGGNTQSLPRPGAVCRPAQLPSGAPA